MTTSQKIVSGIILAAGISVGALNLPSNENIKQTEQVDPTVLNFNDEQIKFGYTDDNTGENLIIHTDSASYSCWQTCPVYFSIENTSGSDQNTNLQVLDSTDGTSYSLQEFVPQVPYQEEVTDFGTSNNDCLSGWISTGEPNKYSCDKQVLVCDSIAKNNCVQTIKTGSHFVTKFKDEWQTIGQVVPDQNLKLRKSKVPPVKFTAKEQSSYLIKSGEVKYFKALSTFPQNNQGEFYINAYGASAFGSLDPGFYSTWPYRMAITVNHLKVGATSTVTNFPFLVSTTSPNLKVISSGGHMGRSDGLDSVFTSSDGVTPLNYEMEQYASTTGAEIAWVNIGTVSSSTDTVIYQYYGNAAASDQSNKTAVWDANYRLVYHLADGTTLNGNDSTSFANNGTTVTATASSTGQIDGSAAFNGTTQTISLSSTASLMFTGPQTLDAWFYETDNSNYRAVIVNGGSSTRSGSMYLVSGSLNAIYYNNIGGQTLSASWSLNTWNHLVLTDDGTNLKMYLNGNLVYSGTNGTGALGNSLHFGVGYNSDDVNFGMQGKIDEARISSTVRNESYIFTEYNNESSPSTFETWGAEESAPSGTASPYGALNIGTSSLNAGTSSLNIGN